MPENVSSALVKKRSGETGQKLDIHETHEDYLEKCRAAASYVSKKCGWCVIPCADENALEPYSRDEIAEKIAREVDSFLEKHGSHVNLTEKNTKKYFIYVKNPTLLFMDC